MTGKYETLDAAIITAITAGKTTFGSILRTVESVARPLTTPDRYGRINHDRLVDRRLQALRKQKKINYSSRNWSHVS